MSRPDRMAMRRSRSRPSRPERRPCFRCEGHGHSRRRRRYPEPRHRGMRGRSPSPPHRPAQRRRRRRGRGSRPMDPTGGRSRSRLLRHRDDSGAPRPCGRSTLGSSSGPAGPSPVPAHRIRRCRGRRVCEPSSPCWPPMWLTPPTNQSWHMLRHELGESGGDCGEIAIKPRRRDFGAVKNDGARGPRQWKSHRFVDFNRWTRSCHRESRVEPCPTIAAYVRPPIAAGCRGVPDNIRAGFLWPDPRPSPHHR